MNFLSVLFFILVGTFATSPTSGLQAGDRKEISSQTIVNNQDIQIKAIIFDYDGTLIDNGVVFF